MKTLLRNFLILFALSASYTLKAQDLKRVKNVIDSLCAPGMHGRGYTYNGDKVAANFIASHFKASGLKSFYGESYFQNFSLDVNTFPHHIHLTVDGKHLVPGQDYIVDAHSQAGKGHCDVLYLDSAFLFSKEEADILEEKRKIKTGFALEERFFQLLRKKNPIMFTQLHRTPLLVLLADKLTMTVGDNQALPSTFIVKKDKYPTKAESSASFGLNAVLEKNYQTQNVVGYVKGTQKPDSFLVFSAHYDHLGNLGKQTYFPGANDNASGVAMLLELADYFAKNPPKCSVAFIAFGAEEAGLIGSEYFVANPAFPLKKIKFLLNLDLIGTGEKGCTVVNGTEFKAQFELLKKLNADKNYLATVNIRGKAANSDHYYFTEKGVPSFFIYLMGDFPHYHDVNDRAEKLPLGKFESSFKLFVDFFMALD